MTKSKDLFDDSTMSFGEHLEVLRWHLWRAIVGVVICVAVSLFFGERIVGVIRAPIDRALAKRGLEAKDDIGSVNVWQHMLAIIGNRDAQKAIADQEEKRKQVEQDAAKARQFNKFELVFESRDLLNALHEANPDQFPLPKKPPEEELSITVTSPELGTMAKNLDTVQADQRRPVTLTAQEAFMTYMKVALVAGLVIASPWVFYQLWLFVAAGLYPHERRYVYVYLPMSLGLFVFGVVFCFYAVFPVLLGFLLDFNSKLGVTPQIRLSEWISFALMLPLMFGVSFQLPLVMLFLDRISIFDVSAYRDKRRMAILVIAILSMILTPSPDPFSMILMMVPLVALYELGIFMCARGAKKRPFEAPAV